MKLAKKLILVFAVAAFALPVFVSAATIGRPMNNFGLLGYWPLDGNTINWTTYKVGDLSGNDNTGTLSSAFATASSSSQVAGKIGGALNFTASPERVISANNQSIGTGAFSVSAWFKTTDAARTPAIISFGDSATDGLFLRIQVQAGVLKAVAAGSGGGNTAGSGLNDGKWHHMVFTLPAGGTPADIKMYLDGAPKAVSSVGTTPFNISSSAFYIGDSFTSDGNFTYRGALDEIRVYSRTLSAQEAQQLYNVGSVNVGHTQVGPNAPLSRGLVGYWPLDGNTTNWAVGSTSDISGSNLGGKLVDMSTTSSVASGRIGQSLKFNGNAGYVLGSSMIPYLADSYTVSAWVKENGSNTSGGRIVSTDGNFAGPVVDLYLTGGGVRLESDTTDQVTYSTFPSDRKWHHVVGARNSVTGGLALYIDGVQVASAIKTTGSNPLVSNATLRIGARTSSGVVTSIFNGNIDDVRVYNRMLSAQEVQQLYNLGSTNLAHTQVGPNAPFSQGLVGYWSFDGWRLTDQSSTATSSQLLNFTSTTTIAGRIGQALNFNGVNNTVLTGSLGDIRTVAAWIKPDNASGDHTILYHATNKWWFTITNNVLRLYDLASCNLTQNGDAAGTLQSAVVTFALNKWQFVGFTSDPVNKVFSFYYNNQVTTLPDYISTANCATSSSEQIGSTNSRWFSGGIDDLRIYNRTLTPQEMQQLYLMGK